jgi:hypothetical protein
MYIFGATKKAKRHARRFAYLIFWLQFYVSTIICQGSCFVAFFVSDN